MPQDGLASLAADKAQALQKSGCSRYIVGACFQTVWQKIRHLLLQGGAARPAKQDGLR